MISELLTSRCLEYLLRNDANPGIRDNQGYNAVHYASAYGHRLCLELVSQNHRILDALHPHHFHCVPNGCGAHRALVKSSALYRE